MKIVDHPQHDEASTPHRIGGADDAGVGPQGAALILELQRLRQAFERENIDELPRQPPRRPARDGQRRAARPKPPPKGKMSRVLDACLAPLGFHGDGGQSHGRQEPPMQRQGRAAREPAAANSPRARGPIIAPDDPSLLNMAKPRTVSAIEHEPPPLHVEAPSLAPSGATGKTANENPPTRTIEKYRRGLVAGAAFLVNRDGATDAPGENIVQRAGRAFERELRTGLRALLIVGILAGGWMALMPLAGAVVVPGNLVVQSNVKTIQHPTGGVVAEIAVRNGVRVGAGDLLLRLDATQAQASLQMVSKQLDEVRTRIARLTAERDGLPRPAVPAELSARLDDGNVKTLLASEASLFRARSTARESQKELLQSRVSQLGEEIGGLDAQVASKARQLELITGELSGVQDLYDKRLVPLTRLTTLQRESARARESKASAAS